MGNKGKRALLCKPSCDVDSHKPFLAVMLNQGSVEKTQEERALLCKADRYIRKPNLELVRDSSKETEGKRKQQENGPRIGTGQE
jgi:hypothetical protein